MALVMLFVFLLSTGPIWSLPSLINIGGIFDTDDQSLEVAFLDAINRINNNGSILPIGSRLVPQIQRITAGNSFQASKTVCLMMSNGVAAMFGPQNRDSWVHVQSVCDTLSVPHFDTRWNYNWERKSLNSLNLFPHGPTLGKAYMDLVRRWNWQSFAIIYQDNEGLIRLKDLFKSPGRSPLNIMVVKLPARGKYHNTLRRVMKAEHHNIVIDCDSDIVYKVLQHAQQIGMMTDKHHYFITSLDVDTVDLDDFSYSGTIITSLRLVDTRRVVVKDVLRSMRQIEKTVDPLSNSINTLKTEAALISDAVYIFANGLKRLDDVTRSDIKPLSCNSDEKWEDGETLFNYLNEIVLDGGLSGKVTLDSKGDRTNFELDIIELNSDGSRNIGVWSSRSGETKVIGSHFTRNTTAPVFPGTLRNKFLNITMLIVDPYIMVKDSTGRLVGNDRFEGYCVELLEYISSILGFNYSLYQVADKNHGSMTAPGRPWNGLIGELQTGKADLAIGDITITSARQAVVDFTTPFMNTGISILFRAPTRAPPNLLSFLSPFSNSVWLLMGVTYMAVSVILFIVARLTPYEWDNPYPCIQDPDEVSNCFTILNSMWFTIGSLMQQGSDIAPKASSTRSIAGIWWFFTLIMISSYTANLAAFLTVENLETPIRNARELEAQNKIKYGCLKNGATCAFFNGSQVDLYKRMWSAMVSATPSVFVPSNNEGISRVSKGNYAFFIESASNEYNVERNCNLTQIGGLLDAKGYGIAMQKDSPYRNELSAAILQLQEKGILASLKTKWWKQKKGGGQCKDNGNAPQKPLDLSNVGGIFVVLIGGGCLATLVAIIEFCWKTRQIPRSQRKPICGEMLDELMLAVRCKGTKAVVKNKEDEPASRFSMNDEYVYS